MWGGWVDLGEKHAFHGLPAIPFYMNRQVAVRSDFL